MVMGGVDAGGGSEERRSILVVDDNEAVIEIFGLVLEKAGYDVSTVTSGAESVAYLENARPDLIILDVMMGDMDGWETLALIRKNPRTTDTPVIMLTGKAPLPEDIWRFGPEIEGYLLKPIMPSDLRKKIDHFWEIERTCREQGAKAPDRDEAHRYMVFCRRSHAFEQLIEDVWELYRLGEAGLSGEVTEEFDRLRAESRRLAERREEWRARLEQSS